MSDIKIMALGGVRENGKNLYIAEVKDSIFVLDAGLKYPENEQLGVDVIVPNFDYLVENKNRVAGIFLTHGHADAIGALPYLLEKVKVPVFTRSALSAAQGMSRVAIGSWLCRWRSDTVLVISSKRSLWVT